MIDKPYRNESLVLIGSRYDSEAIPSGFQLDDDTVEDMRRDDREIIAWMELPSAADFDFSNATKSE